MTYSVQDCRFSQLLDRNKTHKPTPANTSKPRSKNQTNPPNLPHPSNQLQNQHCETKEFYYQYYIPFPRSLVPKCLQCKRAIAKNTTPLSCDSCGKYATRHAQNYQKHSQTKPQSKPLGGPARSVIGIDLNISIKLEAQLSRSHIWTKETTLQAFVSFSGTLMA